MHSAPADTEMSVQLNMHSYEAVQADAAKQAELWLLLLVSTKNLMPDSFATFAWATHRLYNAC